MKALYSEKEMLMASNKSLAEYNLSQEDPLTKARCRLQEKHREVRRLAEKVRNAKRDVDDKAGHTEPDTMLALLQAAGAEADEESEAVADEFMQNQGDVDEFIKTFMVIHSYVALPNIGIIALEFCLNSRTRGSCPTCGGSRSTS